jgi:putative transposase
VRDRIEQPAAQLALEWPAWGHRKIWALLEADGFHAREATVRRALKARALLQPPGAGRERREPARKRKAIFGRVPARRKRLADRLHRARDARGRLAAGRRRRLRCQARARLPGHRDQDLARRRPVLETARERARELLGRPLSDDLSDPPTGELLPIVVVSDNGACYRASGFARHIAARPEFEHVRTRYKAPQTNAVVERWPQSLNYEHLYRHQIDDGPGLAAEVERFLDVYNARRPHEALDFQPPIDRHLRQPPATLEPAIQTGPRGSRPRRISGRTAAAPVTDSGGPPD